MDNDKRLKLGCLTFGMNEVRRFRSGFLVQCQSLSSVRLNSMRHSYRRHTVFKTPARSHLHNWLYTNYVAVHGNQNTWLVTDEMIDDGTDLYISLHACRKKEFYSMAEELSTEQPPFHALSTLDKLNIASGIYRGQDNRTDGVAEVSCTIWVSGHGDVILTPAERKGVHAARGHILKLTASLSPFMMFDKNNIMRANLLSEESRSHYSDDEFLDTGDIEHTTQSIRQVILGEEAEKDTPTTSLPF